MPTYARREIVVEDTVGVYHCIARCVRRAFLCGVDPYIRRDYSHRKEWILDRMRELAGRLFKQAAGQSSSLVKGVRPTKGVRPIAKCIRR
jgi:hypothetical protein